MAEVYGESYIETARDKLKALMDALITSMASGYDPALSYAYDGHNVADIQLSAVSVDCESAEWDDSYPNTPSVGLYWGMRFSLRVHTAYIGGVMDNIKTSRLMTSVANKLFANRNLAGGYRITAVGDVTMGDTFNHTLGGTISVIVNKFENHTQE